MKNNQSKEDNQSESTRQSKNLGWVRSLPGPLFVGVIMLVGQAFLQPWVAEGVKTKESILEQKYKAYDSAVRILQRRLASVKITGDNVPEWAVASEKNPPTHRANFAMNIIVSS